MNEILIILGLFIDFSGAFILLYDEYVVGKITNKRPDLLESVEKINRWSRQSKRKNALIALVIGFIVQMIGTASPPF